MNNIRTVVVRLIVVMEDGKEYTSAKTLDGASIENAFAGKKVVGLLAENQFHAITEFLDNKPVSH